MTGLRTGRTSGASAAKREAKEVGQGAVAVSSKAAEAFVKNFKDVHRLLELHTKEGGSAKGRRYGLEVLNKAAVVLITAFWEAYCEDLAAEGLQHLLDYSESADTLPKLLRKQLAEEIKRAPNELEVWSLAGNGWKTYLSKRMKDTTDNRNRRLNTPSYEVLSRIVEDLLHPSRGSRSPTTSISLDGWPTLRRRP
jgi:HEPN superfamily RiboL-PSP-like protein